MIFVGGRRIATGMVMTQNEGGGIGENDSFQGLAWMG